MPRGGVRTLLHDALGDAHELLDGGEGDREAAPTDHGVELGRHVIGDEHEPGAEVGPVLKHPPVHLATDRVDVVPRRDDHLDRALALEVRLGAKRAGRGNHVEPAGLEPPGQDVEHVAFVVDDQGGIATRRRHIVEIIAVIATSCV